MDIWSILGIDETAGVDAIRAAYSEKVKDHHPEDDPEGFMRVREAYKAAIRIASGRATGSAVGVPVAPAAQKARTAQPQPTEPQPTEPQPQADSANAFDFSRLSGEKAERAEETQPISLFDFSGLSGEKAERTEDKTPELVFDFSGVERASDEHFEREKKLADDFIARAAVLYKSRWRGKMRQWRELFASADKSLNRSEYFTWAFLDFLAMTPEIPEKARKMVVDPFAAELRGYWQGTLLWGEFDVATRKYLWEALQKDDFSVHLQRWGAAHFRLILTVIAVIALVAASVKYVNSTNKETLKNYEIIQISKEPMYVIWQDNRNKRDSPDEYLNLLGEIARNDFTIREPYIVYSDNSYRIPLMEEPERYLIKYSGGILLTGRNLSGVKTIIFAHTVMQGEQRYSIPQNAGFTIVRTYSMDIYYYDVESDMIIGIESLPAPKIEKEPSGRSVSLKPSDKDVLAAVEAHIG